MNLSIQICPKKVNSPIINPVLRMRLRPSILLWGGVWILRVINGNIDIFGISHHAGSKKCEEDRRADSPTSPTSPSSPTTQPDQSRLKMPKIVGEKRFGAVYGHK